MGADYGYMASSQLSANPPKSSESDTTGEAVRQGLEAESVLELLGDEYTQRILSAIGDSARTGRELVDSANVSKATAYRRLDELQDAGIVDSTMRLDPDGHHCEQYRLAVDELSISISPSGFEVTVTQDTSDSVNDSDVQLSVPADD